MNLLFPEYNEDVVRSKERISSISLINEIREFSDFGSKTIIEYRNGIEYLINEYWTSKQRQANPIHEVSYRACFKPQLVKFFIERCTRPGEIVYDPFMGRGTTAVESSITGRIPYGNDINPLSIAFAEPRINPPTLNEVSIRLESIPWKSFNCYSHEELLVFYHPRTLNEIEGLRTYFLNREREEKMDKVDRWIRMVAINRLTGHSPGFFSVYTLPPNQAVSVKRQKSINLKRRQKPEYRSVRDRIYRKSRLLLSGSEYIPKSESSKFLCEFSWATPQIDDQCVSLVVTSPPFLDIVDYEGDNWLRCWFIGERSPKIEVSMHKKIEEWEDFVRKTLVELARVTKPNAIIAFEVGEVRNGEVFLEDYVIRAAKDTLLHPLCVLINQQEFTKTSNCWGVGNNSRGTNTNRVVILERRSRRE